jgi:hypothetical protein
MKAIKSKISLERVESTERKASINELYLRNPSSE